MIKKFQTKTFKSKSPVVKLREIDDALAQIEIDKVQIASLIQSAIKDNDENRRRAENRRLVALSSYYSRLVTLRQEVARAVRDKAEISSRQKGVRSAKARIQQGKSKSAGSDEEAVRQEEGNVDLLREGEQVRKAG